MTLGRRLVLGFLAVTIPGTLVLGAVTLYSLRSVNAAVGELRDITLSLETTRDLHVTLLQAEGAAVGYLLGGTVTDRHQFYRHLAAAEKMTESCGRTQCHGAPRTPTEMARLLAPAMETLRVSADRIFDTAEPEEGSAVTRLMPVHSGIATIEMRLQPMSATLRARVDQLATRAESVGHTAVAVIGLLTFALVLTATGAAGLLASRIARPLRDLLVGTGRVKIGDWSVRVREGHDEIGQLGASFNAMVSDLREYRERVEEYSGTLEARVRQRTEELERKDRALVESKKLASLGLLAAGVAHEINGPLTSIVMKANLLMEELEAHPGAVDELRKIDDDAMRCQRIVEDLRAFARRREVAIRRGRVDAVVARALASATPELELRRIHVATELPADLPDVVWDPDRMAQVLTHLLLNAAHALERGGSVTVTARATAETLTVEVRDTGCGIPAAHLAKIFDPFFTTKASGTGLGLSICHGIVTEHGGRIGVDSRWAGENGVKDGETGTTVAIIVPLVAAQPA